MEFSTYILGELLWELEQFDMQVPGLQRHHIENVEVLSYSSRVLRFKTDEGTFEALLSWTGDVAPIIKQAVNDAY
ncbi:MAG TPA: hypothetical protein VF719_00160 [Abditibacteriaceae bacterium]